MKALKRIISLCLMLVMLAGLVLTGHGVSSSSDEAGIFRGDVSGDGRINVGDVSIIYAHAKKTKFITDAHKFACADYNGDGRVNVGDAGAVYAVVKGGSKPIIKSVSISVWTGMNDQRNADSWLQQREAAFQKAHPEYKITWENGECHEGDAAHMITADPKAAADVYVFANDQIGTLVNVGAMTALTGKYLKQVQEDNAQTLVNTVTYTDGSVYGFPLTNNTWFMYYNKEIFSAEDVKSLDTMLTKGVVAFPWETGWYSGSFFLANGGTLFGDKGIDASAGIQFGPDNGGYEAALKMVQLAANPNMLNDISGDGYFGLCDGSVGAYFSGSWDYYGLYEALGHKLGAVQLPMVEIGGRQKQMKSFAGSKGVAVNPHADEPALAMEFAAFLATPESQKLRYQDNGTIPAAAALAQDPDIQNDLVALAEINTMTNAAVVQPSIPEMSNYWTPVGNFGSQITNGQINEDNYKEMVGQLMKDLNAVGI